MFEVVLPAPGVSYWEARVSDAIAGDAPYYRSSLPKRGYVPADPMDVAALALRKANDGLGECLLSEVRDGVTTFLGAFKSLPVFGSYVRSVVCLSTTDTQRCPATKTTTQG